MVVHKNKSEGNSYLRGHFAMSGAIFSCNNCWFKTSGAYQVKPETYMEGNERPKKKAGHSSLVGGGRFNKQENLHRRLILAVT